MNAAPTLWAAWPAVAVTLVLNPTQINIDSRSLRREVSKPKPNEALTPGRKAWV